MRSVRPISNMCICVRCTNILKEGEYMSLYVYIELVYVYNAMNLLLNVFVIYW